VLVAAVRRRAPLRRRRHLLPHRVRRLHSVRAAPAAVRLCPLLAEALALPRTRCGLADPLEVVHLVRRRVGGRTGGDPLSDGRVLEFQLPAGALRVAALFRTWRGFRLAAHFRNRLRR
jgi:hypothetical protein